MVSSHIYYRRALAFNSRKPYLHCTAQYSTNHNHFLYQTQKANSPTLSLYYSLDSKMHFQGEYRNGVRSLLPVPPPEIGTFHTLHFLTESALTGPKCGPLSGVASATRFHSLLFLNKSEKKTLHLAADEKEPNFWHLCFTVES